MKVNDPETIRSRILDYARRPEPTEFSHKAKYAVRTIYQTVLENLPGMQDADHARYLIWGWVLAQNKELHSADLIPQEWNALGRWATEFRDGQYQKRQAFDAELAWVLTMARADEQQRLIGQGQLSLPVLAPVETDPDSALLETAIKHGGVPHEITNLPAQQPTVNDIPWCEWCGEVPCAPGVPCTSCEILGANEENKPISRQEWEKLQQAQKPVQPVAEYDPAFE